MQAGQAALTAVAGTYAGLSVVAALFADRDSRAAVYAATWAGLHGVRDPVSSTTLAQAFRRVSILKPVRGLAASLESSERAFRSWTQQKSAVPRELIFSLQDAADPAFPVLARLGERAPWRVIVNPVKPGYSGKMSNLEHALEASTGDALVLSDGDIEAAADTVERLLRILYEADIVSCLPIHDRPDGIWGRLYANTWNSVMLMAWAPGVVRGRPFGVAGGTLALRRATLEQLGGLAAYRSRVAEDLAIGREAFLRGLRIRLGPVVRSPVGRMTLDELWQKWMRGHLASMRGGVGFLPTLGMNFFVLGWVWILCLGQWQLALITLATRMFLLARLAKLCEGRYRLPWEIVMGDPLAWWSFLSACLYPVVNWGGIDFRVERDGTLKRLSPRAQKP